MSDENRPEQHAIGKRIIRTATAAERNRHADVRTAMAVERDEIAAWARSVAAGSASQVAVGAVFTAAPAAPETPWGSRSRRSRCRRALE